MIVITKLKKLRIKLKMKETINYQTSLIKINNFMYANLENKLFFPQRIQVGKKPIDRPILNSFLHIQNQLWRGWREVNFSSRSAKCLVENFVQVSLHYVYTYLTVLSSLDLAMVVVALGILVLKIEAPKPKREYVQKTSANQIQYV